MPSDPIEVMIIDPWNGLPLSNALGRRPWKSSQKRRLTAALNTNLGNFASLPAVLSKSVLSEIADATSVLNFL